MSGTWSKNEVFRSAENAAKCAGRGKGSKGGGFGESHPVVQELAIPLHLRSLQLNAFNLYKIRNKGSLQKQELHLFRHCPKLT